MTLPLLKKQESKESSDGKNKVNLRLLEGKQVPKGIFTQKVPAGSWETCFQLDNWTLRIEKTALGLQRRSLIGDTYMNWNPKDYSKEGKKNKKSETEKARRIRRDSIK